MAAEKPRGRVRAVATEVDKPEVPREAAALMRTFHIENQQKNEHDRAATKARKELLGLMLDSKDKHYEITTTIDGSRVTLEAVVDTPEREVIDVEKLKSLVPADVFMKIVSATKTAAETYAGKAIVAQCATKVAGDTNVSVKLKKR